MRVAQEASTHDEGVPDDYLLHRITHGVPEGVGDIPPMKAFPIESNLDVMGARESISYRSNDVAYAIVGSGLPKGLLRRARAHSPNVSYWRDSQAYTSSTSPSTTNPRRTQSRRQQTPTGSRHSSIAYACSRRGARCASQRDGKTPQY